MCTYEHCAEGDQQYDNLNDWISHEVNVHRREIAQQVPHSQQPSGECYSTLGLSKGSFQPQPSVAPNDISRQECPICLGKNPTFYHIGLHLRRFAVFALPNTVETDEDTETGDQASYIADLDEETSMSSQSVSSWVGKDSMHENDEDGELHKRDRSTSETQTDVNRLEHALSQFDGVSDKSNIERYFAGLASENTLSHHGGSNHAESPSQTHHFGSDKCISFYVLIEQLEPNHQAQGAQHGPHGYWSPPTIRIGFITRSRSLFHWRGGTMTHIAPHEEDGYPFGHIQSAATVVTHNPDTPHLLVVPFDVRRRDVIGYPGGWRPLTFRYVRINPPYTYSAVSANGDRQHVAARGSTHWMPQLLPRVYEDQSHSTRTQGGLIGSIPLLIALAAFSAPASFLPQVLTNCVRPQRWQPHQYQYPSGRKLQHSVGIPV